MPIQIYVKNPFTKNIMVLKKGDCGLELLVIEKSQVLLSWQSEG